MADDRPVEISLSGSGPLNAAVAPTTPGDGPPPNAQRSKRFVAIAIVLGLIAAVAIGAAIVTSDDEPTATPTDTTISPALLGTLLTTPPTLPPPTTQPHPTTVTASSATADDATVTQEPLVRQSFPGVPIPLNAVGTSVDEIAARLAEDLPRRTHISLEFGYQRVSSTASTEVIESRADIVIERDPTTDRYRLTDRRASERFVAIFDLAEGVFYVADDADNADDVDPTEWEVRTLESVYGDDWENAARTALARNMAGLVDPAAIADRVETSRGRYFDLGELGYGIFEGFEIVLSDGSTRFLYANDDTIVAHVDSVGGTTTNRSLQITELTDGTPIGLPDPALVVPGPTDG